jgi:hypothetical protein
MENLIAIALGVTLANNDVAVAVNLCGVHGASPFKTLRQSCRTGLCL